MSGVAVTGNARHFRDWRCGQTIPILPNRQSHRSVHFSFKGEACNHCLKDFTLPWKQYARADRDPTYQSTFSTTSSGSARHYGMK
jgi:hypothetical protein